MLYGFWEDLIKINIFRKLLRNLPNFDQERSDSPKFGTFDCGDSLSNRFFAEKAEKSDQIKREKFKIIANFVKDIVLQL